MADTEVTVVRMTFRDSEGDYHLRTFELPFRVDSEKKFMLEYFYQVRGGGADSIINLAGVEFDPETNPYADFFRDGEYKIVNKEDGNGIPQELAEEGASASTAAVADPVSDGDR